MKIKLFMLALSLPITSLLQVAFAASSGSEGNPESGDLYWYCASLQAIYPPPSVPARETLCFAYSPDESLDPLEFTTTTEGESRRHWMY
jgi:hypothetical protein